ncbi:MAG: riboflavin synthase [Firmicutes bacterium]|uniref:Riboflavin synthase n=1 Tax=Sulfobacillus benefaciens TaxID=453960 RepID=A0A2T2WRR6_9FIRM|nr:riboflavin synthase [Bacillota bacterium]MCL5014329.1 riboflavin synthase [Bacillota bacterium]PSR24934.1 MAG: riboflavin synthase [Sulfobacillus benefaciens]
MFSGLVERVGSIQNVQTVTDSPSSVLTVFCEGWDALQEGESVSINGVCLTVTQFTASAFQVECSPTTLAITTLGILTPGQLVNLERAVTPSTRLGGHWVQGHVDTQGHVVRIETQGDARHVVFSFPSQYRPLIVPFGSITVDGVSLTVVQVDGETFQVTLIPYTQSHTTLGALHLHQAVNLEFDVLGKYVQQLCAPYLGTEQKVPHYGE